MRALLIVLLLLVACDDTTSFSPCSKADMPSAPFEWAQRFIDGDRLEWRWQVCPATIDCEICYQFTEVWKWVGCKWEYVETVTDEKRCHP